MKLSTIYKLSGTSLLALSLAIIPFTTPGQAQIGAEEDIAVVETEDNGFDWGLLGLLGLLGLAGLAGKNKQTHSNYETRTTTEPRTGTEPFPEAPGRGSNL